MKLSTMPAALFMTALAFCAATSVNAADVDVIGVQVTKPGYGEGRFGTELRAFNSDGGMSVVLLVKEPAGGLIEIDEEASKVTSLVDSNGTNLVGAKDRFGRESVRFEFSSISSDSKAGTVNLVSNTAPSGDATSIDVRAELVARTATEKATKTTNVVELKPGTKFSVGGLDFEITKVGKPQFGNAEVAVSLQTTDPIDGVAEWGFVDSNGQAIETTSGGMMTMGFGGKSTVTKDFLFEKKVDQAALSIEIWTDMKETRIPVEVSVGLGL